MCVLILLYMCLVLKLLYTRPHTTITKTANASKPFGGLQIIACGDFFQLPPVSGRDEPQAKLCFEAKVCLSVYAAHAPQYAGACTMRCVCVFVSVYAAHAPHTLAHASCTSHSVPTASCARASETVRCATVCLSVYAAARTSYWYVCVHILLHMCPHTAINVSK